MKNLILTALDDNHALWYDNLIPFLLSLKQTDYQGAIGVLDYGLSEDKKQLLNARGIHIFTPKHAVTELLLDRQLSAADIAKQQQVENLALYDCDIWFPQQKFNLFEQLQDPNKLYATFDPWRCTFLTNCVQPHARESVNAQLDLLEAQQGYMWQAGLLAGSAAAWEQYQDYLLAKLAAQQHDFLMHYGIDSTLLNLYAQEKNGLAFIHQKYNAPPVWGIEERQTATGTALYVKNEAVQGLHVTRRHRQESIAYPKYHEANYFHAGKDYVPDAKPMFHIVRESLIQGSVEAHNLSLTLKEAYADGGHLAVHLEASGEVYKKGALWLEVAGNSRIVLQNHHNESKRLQFFCQNLLNFAPCRQIDLLRQNGETFAPQLNQLYFIELQPNEWVELRTHELDRQTRRIRWVLDNVRLI